VYKSSNIKDSKALNRLEQIARLTFLRLDAVALQLPEADLVLYGHREQRLLYDMGEVIGNAHRLVVCNLHFCASVDAHR
jgi:hypothetical protein